MNKKIFIIGAGTAGIACAIRAVERGLQVIVIEKACEVGGTLHITAGHLSAANTKRQKEKNIEDSTLQHYQDIVTISRNTMDAEIANKATQLAPITLDWLDDLGYPFHEKTPMIIHGHEPYTVARTYFGVDDVKPLINKPGKTILNLLKPIFDKYVAEGKIEIHLNTSLIGFDKFETNIQKINCTNSNLKLEVSFNVHSKQNGGEDVVILTTGGYASNHLLFNQVTSFESNSQRLISSAKETSTGDGIIAAINIGAKFYGGEKHSSTLGGIEFEPNSGRANFWEAWARVTNGVDRKQREIYVNDFGIRFMNEFDINVDERERIVLQQPNKRFWIIFDENALQDGASLIPQFSVEQIIAESKNEKCIWQATSLKELAFKIGINENVLEATVSTYNNFVYNQKDEEFQRTYLDHKISKPPFYAVLTYAYSLISFGGLKVNKHLQVQTNEGYVINNLYAAGEILGAASTSGHAFCGGMLLTPALSFGKWLGETV